MTRLPTPLRPWFPFVKRTVVRSTQMVGPLTRRLPATAARPGPPRFTCESTEAYALRRPASAITTTQVVPGIERRLDPPPGLPPDHGVFAAHRRMVVPPCIVATIPRGRVVGPFAAVVGDDDTLLFDLSPYYGAFRATQHPVFLRLRLPPVEEYQGALAVLNTRGADNYYHFLTDVLPRLDLLRRADATVDAYLVDRNTPFQREILEHLGIDPARTFSSAEHPHVRARQLVVPSLPDNHLRAPPWIVSWLRATFLPADPGPTHRRLYVTRGRGKNTRRIENEEELLGFLTTFGFEGIDPGSMPVGEQIRAFAEAEAVVAPHGAALTNVVFCQPATTVIELFAPRYVNLCYWNLASSVDGLHYRYLVNGDSPRRGGAQIGVTDDMTVDLRALGKLLAPALA